MMKKEIGFWALFSIIIFAFMGVWFQSYFSGEVVVQPSSAATSSAVTVSASVGAVISCSTNVGSTDLGALTSGSISTASPNASTTMSCTNSATGCTLSIKDAGGGGNPGLWNSVSSYIIPSPNAAYAATSTLSAGTEGFGVQATTTASGSGGALGVASRYLQTGNTVGGLTLGGATLASSTAAATNREIVITHKVAISGTTVGGNYADTITYSCLAN